MPKKEALANPRVPDITTATVGEGLLILLIAAIGWATRQPLIFASLGPTAYEMVEKPRDESSRPYNIILGHLTGLAAGFLAVYLLNAWAAPGVESAGFVTPARLWAATLAATLTTLATLILKAGQPAAIATSLLVALGSMQSGRDAVVIIGSVLLITAIGEPLRRVRIRIMDASKESRDRAKTKKEAL